MQESKPFLALAEDDNTYWVKPLGNPHGLTSLIAEQVVAHIGFLIGAPVRPVTLVDIPQTMDGWPYGEGLRVRPGVAHASLHLESHPLSATSSSTSNVTTTPSDNPASLRSGSGAQAKTSSGSTTLEQTTRSGPLTTATG